ncbi:hypothetical protein, partial [Paenibacillus senegalensis]|uniref:hypothetical protein n=1 Tax=Paenibacillus senegalensis TaxID=1465766 RepID=UPI000289408F
MSSMHIIIADTIMVKNMTLSIVNPFYHVEVLQVSDVDLHSFLHIIPFVKSLLFYCLFFIHHNWG